VFDGLSDFATINYFLTRLSPSLSFLRILPLFYFDISPPRVFSFSVITEVPKEEKKKQRSITLPERNSEILRKSYREGNTIRKRTPANLSKLPDTVIDNLKIVLKGGPLSSHTYSTVTDLARFLG
jgi:hypothetical protein